MSPTLKVRVSLVPSTIQLIMTLCKALWRVCDSVVVPRARPSVQALQEPDSYEARRDGLVPQELGGQHDTERHRRPVSSLVTARGPYTLTRYVCSVEEIAKKRGVSMAQVAIAWEVSKDGTMRVRQLYGILISSPGNSCGGTHRGHD